jgi:hypothetical protein
MNPMPQEQVPHTAPDRMDELTLIVSPKGTKAMLLHEDLARERRREAERVARNERLGRQLSAVRRWERISKWAARRARRAADLV